MKRIPLLLLLSFLSVATFGQGFYFRTGLGYAFPSAGQSIDGSGTPYSGTYSGTSGNYSIKSASFAAGLQGQLALGYLINRHIGVQLDFNIGVSPKKYSFTATNVNVGGYAGNITFQAQAKSSVLAIPSIVLQNGGDLWNLYSRLGVVLPINTKLIIDQVQVNAPGTGATTVDDFTFEMTNSFSLGMAAAVGLQYRVNERLCIWGEVSMISLSVYAKQQKLTAVSENGISYPLTAVSGNQVINYSKNITADSTGANQPTYSQPFSNVGINFGIRVSLFGNSKSPSRPSSVRSSDRPKPAKFR